MNRASGGGQATLPCDVRSIPAPLSWAHGEDLHLKRRPASTPTRFTRGPASRALHSAAESAPSAHFPGRERRPRAAADTLEPTPQRPPKSQQPGTPCCAPRESRKDASLSHNAFLRPEEPTVRRAGVGMDCTTDAAISPASVWPEGEVHRGRLRRRFPRKRALTRHAPLLLWDRFCPARYPAGQIGC